MTDHSPAARTKAIADIGAILKEDFGLLLTASQVEATVQYAAGKARGVTGLCDRCGRDTVTPLHDLGRSAAP
ncbi:MAG: hypothetical protein ACK4RV_02305 [Caulobacter sp.]